MRISHLFTPATLVCAAALLSACGGGGGGGDGSVDIPSYTVTGTAGTGGAIAPASATVDEGGSTAFTLTPDSGYLLTGATGCGGTLAGDTYTTGTISADCTVSATFTALYSVGGSVSGLSAGNSVTLQQGDDTLTLSADGAFSFPTQLLDGGSYAVTVATQPAVVQQCTVSSGSGTVSGADVADVAVSCVTLPPAAPTVNLGYGIKTLQFSWDAVSGATYYKLDEDPDGASGYSVVANNLAATSVNHDIALYNRINARYMVEACNSAGCSASAEISMGNHLVDAIGYFKASNAEVDDAFDSVSLSADGTTLAVGASREDSSATGVDGDQSDNSASNSGAVYLFTRSGTTWTQQAYLKASNTGANDYFGRSVSLSADGNTLAVGADGESSAATGVDGVQTDNSALYSGAVYLFTRSGASWSQQAYLKASNTGQYDRFGHVVSLSADGNTLAVGAGSEASADTGVGGDQLDNTAPDSGAVYLFTRSDTGWAQQAYLKASNTERSDFFGSSITLSADGTTLAVGASGEDSNATGVGGDETDNSALYSGAVYLFTLNTGSWSQQAYLKASNTEAEDYFGRSVSLSADGNTLAVGAYDEDSSATGVNGNQLDNSIIDTGAVYLFTRSGTTWSQQAYLKASNTGEYDEFGSAVSLSADGNTLAVGAYAEKSSATGVDGDQLDDSAVDSGAVYLFTRSGTTWSQQAYLKAANTGADDWFATSVSLSADGNTLAVGAEGESSSATGVNGDGTDDSTSYSGAVYLY